MKEQIGSTGYMTHEKVSTFIDKCIDCINNERDQDRVAESPRKGTQGDFLPRAVRKSRFTSLHR